MGMKMAEIWNSASLIEFFRGRPRGGDNFTFPSAPDPLSKALQAPFLP